MNELRAMLAIIGGGSFCVLLALIVTGLQTDLTVGVCVAIISATVIGIYLIRAIQTDRDDQRRLNQEAVWMRREQDPDWVFNAPYWQIPELTDKETNQ